MIFIVYYINSPSLFNVIKQPSKKYISNFKVRTSSSYFLNNNYIMRIMRRKNNSTLKIRLKISLLDVIFILFCTLMYLNIFFKSYVYSMINYTNMNPLLRILNVLIFRYHILIILITIGLFIFKTNKKNLLTNIILILLILYKVGSHLGIRFIRHTNLRRLKCRTPKF